jgi:hypothetical protein
MNIEKRPSVDIDATYYRGHGLHKTELKGAQGSPLFIASAETWPDMADMLRSVTWGTVVANDYATFDKDISEAPVDIDKVNERNRFIQYLSYDNDVTIHVGTAHQLGSNVVRLAAATYRWGEVKYADKSALYPVEEKGGLSPAPRLNGDHVRDDGTALVVCSDLPAVERYFTDDEKQHAKRLFAVTEWAYSYTGEDDEKKDKYTELRRQVLEQAIKRAGGKDNYYKDTLEYAVKHMVLPALPHVNTVVVADKGVPGIDAYNVVYTRKPKTKLDI